MGASNISKQVLAVAVIGITAVPAGAGVFSDTTFNTVDYTLTTYAAPLVTTTLGQTTSGNPGTALEGTFSAPGANPNGELYVALNNTFVYNPAVSGAIASLDV